MSTETPFFPENAKTVTIETHILDARPHVPAEVPTGANTEGATAYTILVSEAPYLLHALPLDGYDITRLLPVLVEGDNPTVVFTSVNITFDTDTFVVYGININEKSTALTTEDADKFIDQAVYSLSHLAALIGTYSNAAPPSKR